MFVALIGIGFAKAPRADGDACWAKGNGAAFVGQTELLFLTKAAMEERERESAAAELRSPEPVPFAGGLIARIGRSDIDHALGRNHTLIALGADGAELVRLDGDGVPDTPSGLYKYWHSSVVAPVPATAVFPLRVAVADKLFANRCEWTVGADGSVTQVKVAR
jgi:hypothetical protein